MRLIFWLPLLSLASAHLERRSQPGAHQPASVDLRPLEWGDVNFIATTDTHGWLAGHPDDPSYSGDFGDFASFLSHMRDQAKHRRRDLFVVDSGDLHHGTGLAGATKTEGELSDPVFDKIRYDILSPGNHELYYDEIVDTMHKVYVPKWGNRYMTSNVFFKDIHTNETIPLGKQYTTFRGKFGTKVLAYGFMYNFHTPATNAIVEPSNVTVEKPWFQQSLKEECDIIVVVGHCPIRFPETKAVYDAIRKVHTTKPIIFFGGHNHKRDFAQYDERAAGMSAGRFMETVGWMSIKGVLDPACSIEGNCIGKNLTFHRRYMDTNRYTYKFHSLAHPNQKFDTWRGEKITMEIALARRKLHLSKVLGRAPRNYYVNRVPFQHPQSLLKLLQDEVLPTALLAGRPRPGMAVLPTGAIRYDIDKGDFTIDDAYVVCPYPFHFVYILLKASMTKDLVLKLNNVTHPTGSRGEPKAQAMQWVTNAFAPAQAHLTPGYVTLDDYGTGGDDWPHQPIPVYNDAPLNVATTLPAGVAGDTIIELVFADYYGKDVQKALGMIDPAAPFAPVPYRTDVDLTSLWARFVQSKWN